MAYYIMFLWIPGRDGARSKVTGNVLVNALHTFHRFNRRYHVKKVIILLLHRISLEMLSERHLLGNALSLGTNSGPS